MTFIKRGRKTNKMLSKTQCSKEDTSTYLNKYKEKIIRRKNKNHRVHKNQELSLLITSQNKVKKLSMKNSFT
jgi:hypothetical protein